MLFRGRDAEQHRVVFGQGALAREEERLSVDLPLQPPCEIASRRVRRILLTVWYSLLSFRLA